MEVFEYDKEVDALYINLTEASATDSEEIAPGVVVDYDSEGSVTGIEVRDLLKRIHPTGKRRKAPVQVSGIPTISDAKLREIAKNMKSKETQKSG